MPVVSNDSFDSKNLWVNQIIRKFCVDRMHFCLELLITEMTEPKTIIRNYKNNMERILTFTIKTFILAMGVDDLYISRQGS